MGGSVASDAEKLAKPTRALFTTNYPLAVPKHVLPSCSALCCCCCCCCCCCMLCVCARVVARLTTDATPLLSFLWLLLLNWLYSCAPLWAGACVVAFPPTHFACCVCCGCCEEEQTLHHQHARKVHMVHMAHTWSSLPTNAPTHQEEQTRLPQHTHGISNTC